MRFLCFHSRMAERLGLDLYMAEAARKTKCNEAMGTNDLMLCGSSNKKNTNKQDGLSSEKCGHYEESNLRL